MIKMNSNKKIPKESSRNIKTKETKKKHIKKYVYSFKEGNKEMIKLLGIKGAGLTELTHLKLPVPPGFIITTESCKEFYQNDKILPTEIKEQIIKKITELENETGKKLGSTTNPLFLSVRSGSSVTMPGIMETILNIGLNDDTVRSLTEKTKNERFAFDAYRRFIESFGSIVLGIDYNKFEKRLHKLEETKGYKDYSELNLLDSRLLIREYKQLIKEEIGQEVPHDPMEQLWLSIEAIFSSWNSQKSIDYRRIHNIKDVEGTALTIQEMVFGNINDKSFTGICLTRNPFNGENEIYGEYLKNAQGEEVINSTRTPLPLSELKKEMPEIYNELLKIKKIVEKHYKDMQEIEFTVEDSKLYILQTRTGKRTGNATIRIAIDMVKEKIINEKEAILTINTESLKEFFHSKIDPIAKKDREPISKGLSLSKESAFGKIIFNSKDVSKNFSHNEKIILVKNNLNPDDLKEIDSIDGIIIKETSAKSHLTILSKNNNKAIIVGCSDLIIDEKNKIIKVKDRNITLKEDDWLTIDGETGEIFQGKIPLIEPTINKDFRKILNWAKKYKKLKIEANIDSQNEVKKLKDVEAEGIGLFRTERMFYSGNRLRLIQSIIFSKDEEEKKRMLSDLFLLQKRDFIELFENIKDLDVNIRLLDSSLSDFFPKNKEEIEQLSVELKRGTNEIIEEMESLKEINPSLGRRGSRLLILYPELIKTQVKAIAEAKLESKENSNKNLKRSRKVNLMIPFVNNLNEFIKIKREIKWYIQEVIEEYETKINCAIGILIETPRAALISDELCKEADFFSFGTNDLTGLTFGLSRDDMNKIVPEYLKREIFEFDPFDKIDKTGVGELMRLSIKKAKKIKEKIEFSVCGEQTQDKDSIAFYNMIGINKMSCSCYQIPIAIISAAQVELKNKN